MQMISLPQQSLQLWRNAMAKEILKHVKIILLIIFEVIIKVLSYEAMVCGINSISAENHEKSNITHVVREAIGDHKKLLKFKTGMPSLELVNPDMKAGYFAMLRVRNIDQYYYGEKKINQYISILLLRLLMQHLH